MDLFTLQPTPSSPRELLGLNRGWTFGRGRPRAPRRPGAGDGEAVVLPHTWNDKDTFQEGVAAYQGDGWYHRAIEADLQRKTGRWHLVTEGFYGTGDVWLNGRRVARVDGQFLGVDLDLHDHLAHGGPNDLFIRLTNRCARHVLPGKRQPDFHLHGGLAGRAYLVNVPHQHLDPSATTIRCPGPVSDAPPVEVSLQLHNTSAASPPLTLRATCVDPAGREQVVEETTLDAGPHGARLHAFSFSLPNVQRWDVDTPSLYTLRIELLRDGEGIDALQHRFGIREARFAGRDGFILNGRRLPLRGVNRHQAMPGLGSALPEDLHRQDVEQIKAMGLNLVRLSHYPQHPALLHACDEMGVLVCAELATWKTVRGGRWLRAAERQLRALLERDRHHPSILTWCIGNESRSRKAYLRLDALAGELDPGRPTLYSENHLDRGEKARTTKLVDVLGVNYEIDLLDTAADLSRDGAVLVTETSNCSRAYRGDIAAERAQAERFEKDLALIEAQPATSGFALWCFCDFASQRQGRFRRDPGVVDIHRLPKMSSRLLAARYLDPPRLDVFGDWGREGPGERTLTLVGNAGEVEVWNGDACLARTAVHGLSDVTLPYTAEPLVFSRAGKRTEELARLDPFDAAAAVTLEALPFSPHHDVRAAAWLKVAVVDEHGQRVTNWKGDVVLAAEGEASLGTISRAPLLRVAGGRGRVLMLGEPGTAIKARVSADGLAGASCTVQLLERAPGTCREL